MTTDIDAQRPMNPWLAGLLAAGLVIAAATIGNLATIPNIPTWYAGLNKPPFNPPNWVFGPVWTVLYAAMAFAFWRVLRSPATPERRAALVAFLAQLALNAFWSVAFFGMHNPTLALAIVVAMEIAIIATIVLFRRVDLLSGWILAPYAAWVAFASVLNLSIVLLN